MKIALIHDYLREYGGAERVLEALHDLYPSAPVYTAFFDATALGKQAARFKHWDIRETVITSLPFYKRLFSPYRVWSAWAFAQLDLSAYDVVISSTNMYMAKAACARPGAWHLSYIHTPPRSLYGYTTQSNWRSRALTRIGGELINIWMRYIDYQTAHNPQVLIANGRTTQERIAKFYRRDSVIIPPPVALVDRHLPVLPSRDRDYVLFVGRLAFSKHPQLALSICQQLNLPLKIVGVGAMSQQLRAQAAVGNSPVEFCGSVADAQLAELYQHARVVLFPAEEEDFGIVPIEAMAAGTPVIAHFSGEPRYTIHHMQTGWHVYSWAEADWRTALQQAWEKKWNYTQIQKSVAMYSLSNFNQAVQDLVRQTIQTQKVS